MVMGTGVQFVKPEWFGARGDGRFDDSAAIQKAYDAVKAGGEPAPLPVQLAGRRLVLAPAP